MVPVWGSFVAPVFWWWGWCVFVVWLRGFVGVVSFRPVSASSLSALLRVQVWSIDPVVCGGPYPSKRVRSLVLEEVSRLDAFSGYPVRT